MARAAGSTTLTGYHGCEKDVADRLVAGEPFRSSSEPHQWLGQGVYFWDGDPRRALEWAEQRRHPTPFRIPAVVRVEVVFSSGLNMDLREHQTFVESLYPVFEAELTLQGVPLPENVPNPAGFGRPSILRYRDHAVLEYVCRTLAEAAAAGTARSAALYPPIQVIEGSFQGWKPLYEGGGFYERTHRQFCVRDPSCIRSVELEGVYHRSSRV